MKCFDCEPSGLVRRPAWPARDLTSKQTKMKTTNIHKSLTTPAAEMGAHAAPFKKYPPKKIGL